MRVPAAPRFLKAIELAGSSGFMLTLNDFMATPVLNVEVAIMSLNQSVPLAVRLEPFGSPLITRITN